MLIGGAVATIYYTESPLCYKGRCTAKIKKIKAKVLKLLKRIMFNLRCENKNK